MLDEAANGRASFRGALSFLGAPVKLHHAVRRCHSEVVGLIPLAWRQQAPLWRAVLHLHGIPCSGPPKLNPGHCLQQLAVLLNSQRCWLSWHFHWCGSYPAQRGASKQHLQSVVCSAAVRARAVLLGWLHTAPRAGCLVASYKAAWGHQLFFLQHFRRASWR